MTARTKKGLKLAAAAIFAALLVAITLNAAVDFWTPQAELKDPARAGERGSRPGHRAGRAVDGAAFAGSPVARTAGGKVGATGMEPAAVRAEIRRAGHRA